MAHGKRLRGVVWQSCASRELFRPAGRPLAFLDEPTEETLAGTLRELGVVQPATIVGGLVGGVLRRANPTGWRSDIVLLVDARAPFVCAGLLRKLVVALQHADLAFLHGSGAAIATRGSLLTAASCCGRGRRAADLVELAQLLAARSPRGSRIAEIEGAQDYERVLGTVKEVWVALNARRLALSLNLVQRGLRLVDPARFRMYGKLSFGRNVTIAADVVVRGHVVLGDDVVIESHCLLENVRIGQGSVIKEFSLLSGATIGRDCRVGPYARIRPGTKLGDNGQIGNYVEVKDSTLGRSCRINHHNFIGNALIGHNVTIGAGAITCNYDGTRSQRTRIADGAFVGSGAMLVAPVKVGKHAFVGAGTTLVKNAPANSLTLARMRQTSIAGWVPPAPAHKT